MEDNVKALADKAVKAPKSQDALRFAQAASVLQDIERQKLFMKMDMQSAGSQPIGEGSAEGNTADDAETE